jgi:hypothetical protein
MHRYNTKCPKIIVRAVGPRDALAAHIISWSLKDLFYSQDDVLRYPSLGDEVYQMLLNMGIRNAYAPSVASMNAAVTESSALKTHIRFRSNIYLHRDRDVPVDGLFIQPGEGFVVSAAGCGVIVAWTDEDMVVAHAGRDSLIDRGAVLGTPSRKHFSIVNTILDAFARRGVSAHKVCMCMLFTIRKESFEHLFTPENAAYAEYNRNLPTFFGSGWEGCADMNANKNGVLLDLQEVFKQQAMRAGVLTENVWTEHSLGDHPEMAQTARDGRNLIVIKRRPSRVKALVARSMATAWRRPIQPNLQE